MGGSQYYLTETAVVHYEKAIQDTAKQWGKVQARKYRAGLEAGFQDIVKRNKTFPHRKGMTGETDFFIHHVEHHYVAFQIHDNNRVIISGIFHENRDIPTQLKELQSMSRNDIFIIKGLIAKERVFDETENISTKMQGKKY